MKKERDQRCSYCGTVFRTSSKLYKYCPDHRSHNYHSMVSQRESGLKLINIRMEPELAEAIERYLARLEAERGYPVPRNTLLVYIIKKFLKL